MACVEKDAETCAKEDKKCVETDAVICAKDENLSNFFKEVFFTVYLL